MNNSGEQLPPGLQAASNNKPLWAAVGILGIAVLGMGSAMIYNQRPPAPTAAIAPATTVAALKPAPATLPTAVEKAAIADDLVEKPAAAIQPVPLPAPAPAPAPVKKVVKHAPTPQPQPPRELTYSPAGSSNAGSNNAQGPYPVHAAVCQSCGTIESVTPITRSSKPEGVGIGTVAGGLLGAVLGNQVGHGGGRAAATVLGAVGGGYAGNAIEGNLHKETVYQVGVRMEDGSRRVVEMASAPSVGAPVTVEGSTLRSR